MAQGLMPLAESLTAVHRDAVPVMAVYLPKPSSHSHRVQWPVPTPPAINSSSTSRNRSSSSSGQPPKALSEPVYGTLCSKHSRHEAYVLFINNTPHTVRLMWVNYRGDEIAYDTLLPGHSCIQQTFATHPWMAREVHTATRLPINMQEAFCPHKTQRAQQGPPAPSAAAAAGVPAAAAVAHAAAPAGPQDAAAAVAELAAPAGAQQAQQPPQPQQQQVFSFQGPTGVRHVPFSSLQRAEITLLPALPWSESAHTHFPPAFKAAARTFLLCHLQLQKAMHADHSFGLSTAAAETAPGAAADAADFRSSYHDDMPSPASRSHLGCLPSVLLPHIVGLAAPYAPQHMELPLTLRPDILPTCLAEDPDAPVPTVPEEAEEEWHVAPDQQQQEGGGAGGGGGGLVGAIQAAGAGAGAGAGGNGGVADVGDHAGVQVMGYVPLIDAGFVGGNGAAAGGAVGVLEPAGVQEGAQDDAMIE